ncbi:hypothetical protein [Oscillatoria sp. HE19RPO]|uniref:hypothetical protein n=1 Tax=Oscillatoria sp. HE19RPO TaxID=2954806 RepID=UPI0020C26FC0|nr:hypothetical protein [Oscillatoria sp. HE19RPO]
MHPKEQLEQILQNLRPAFSREAAFEWFVIRVQNKIEALERFVILIALVMGILQILSLSMPSTIWQGFLGSFRTVPRAPVQY